MQRYKFILIIFLLIYFIFYENIACYAAKNNLPVEGSGYVGTLPQLTKEYSSGKNEQDPSSSKSVKPIESKDFNSENEIKPAPNEDPAFVNIILKPNKTSKYSTDLNDFIIILENLYDIIESNSSVQLFNAKVFYFNKNVEYFKDEYSTKPESSFLSYRKLLELNTHTKTIALLRTEAIKYNPYMSYTGAGQIYDPNNIEEQLKYLKTEIKQTILLLRDSI